MAFVPFLSGALGTILYIAALGVINYIVFQWWYYCRNHFTPQGWRLTTLHPRGGA